MSSEGE